MPDAVTLALHAFVLRGCRITSHLFEIWNNCYHSELVSRSMGVVSLAVVFFPVKVLDSLKWREQFEMYCL